MNRMDRKFEKADRDAAKSAARIQDELNLLVGKLGAGIAPQTAFGAVIRAMIERDPLTFELFERALEDQEYWRQKRAMREWRETNPNLH